MYKEKGTQGSSWATAAVAHWSNMVERSSAHSSFECHQMSSVLIQSHMKWSAMRMTTMAKNSKKPIPISVYLQECKDLHCSSNFRPILRASDMTGTILAVMYTPNS